MDVVKIMETFPTQEDCIAYLERVLPSEIRGTL